MSEEDRQRILRIEIPPCLITKDSPDPIWTGAGGLNGWVPLASAPLNVYWKGTIDLSGYARDYKTFYPQGGVIQEGPYWSEEGCAGTIVYTIVSAIPLDPEQVYVQVAGSDTGPGFISWGPFGALTSDQQNWNTVLFAESQLLVPNVNIAPNSLGFLQGLEKRQSGSLTPTAAQVLYCMKMVMPFAVNQTALRIPASRVILPGTMDQEPELEYMMRLARSVELANQV